MIAGEGWAFELTESEWSSLARVICDLTDQHAQLQDQLMPEENILLEMESKPWWVCLDGFKNSWSLQVILQEEGASVRGLEAHWPRPAAQEFAKAVRMMWDSCNL